MKQYKNVNELWGAIVNGDMDPSVSDFFVTGASYIYQTTQFPNSINKYHNYYLLNFPSLKTAAKAAYSSQTTIYL